MKLIIKTKGGLGSGNFGHAGIPGHQGGSAPSGTGVSKPADDNFKNEAIRTLEHAKNEAHAQGGWNSKASDSPNYPHSFDKEHENGVKTYVNLIKDGDRHFYQVGHSRGGRNVLSSEEFTNGKEAMQHANGAGKDHAANIFGRKELQNVTDHGNVMKMYNRLEKEATWLGKLRRLPGTPSAKDKREVSLRRAALAQGKKLAQAMESGSIDRIKAAWAPASKPDGSWLRDLVDKSVASDLDMIAKHH